MTNMTREWLCINNTDGCYAAHSTRANAMASARNLRSTGSYATVWTLKDATRMGLLRGLKNVTLPADEYEFLHS